MPSPQDSVKLSLSLITCNESRPALACLQSAAFAVDSGRSDDTRELAAAFGAQLVRTCDRPGFGPQKYRALALARGRRGPSIDADALGYDLWAFVRGCVLRCGFLAGRLGRVLARYVAEGTCYRPLKVGLLARQHAEPISK